MEGRTLALLVANLGSIFGTPYCLLSPTEMSPEPTARSKPGTQLGEKLSPLPSPQ